MNIQWLKNIIGKISFRFNFNKTNSPSLKINQKAKQIINQHGLSYSEAKDLITSVISQKLIEVKAEAEFIYRERVGEFEKLLTEKISHLHEEEIVKLKEPDTQLALLEAAKISGRKQDEGLRNLLANLVINRIKNDKEGKEELKNIVYNEAIFTVGKLTVDQLKIIALCYILNYTRVDRIDSWYDLNFYLNKNIKPFLGFKNTNAEFQHIVYAGCGSIGNRNISMLDLFKNKHSFLFFKPVEKNRIERLNLQDLVILDEKEDKYFFKFKNEYELKNYLNEKKIDEKSISNITSFYRDCLQDDVEAKKEFSEKTDIGKELIELWKGSTLKHLSLTSVGIAIGVTYCQEVVKAKIDIDTWIY